FQNETRGEDFPPTHRASSISICFGPRFRNITWPIHPTRFSSLGGAVASHVGKKRGAALCTRCTVVGTSSISAAPMDCCLRVFLRGPQKRESHCVRTASILYLNLSSSPESDSLMIETHSSSPMRFTGFRHANTTLSERTWSMFPLQTGRNPFTANMQ